MTSQLQEILKLLKEGLEKTTAFAGEQLPLVAREVLRYAFWQNMAVILLVTIPATIMIYGGWCLHRDGVRQAEHDLSVGGGVLLFFGVVLELGVGGHSLLLLLKIWLAPRVYLLEWARTMVVG